MEFSHIKKGKVAMVDVSNKEEVLRIAIAEGFIRLKRETIEAILNEKVVKGDVLATANIAGVLAVKKTPEIIPMCHPIPITSISLDFSVEKEGIRVRCMVKAIAKTGVEMEAITGVSVALLTIWDMVKSLEKDESGNYPSTCIENVKVLEKVKEKI
ncbi:MAG: cyclic pyranopterin monophosphate synthase MoaC [Archaeoglobales archaeon]|nr:cyclic pyranopterin monophosphate synthase MoaC [Archaeoglobales archaeon]